MKADIGIGYHKIWELLVSTKFRQMLVCCSQYTRANKKESGFKVYANSEGFYFSEPVFSDSENLLIINDSKLKKNTGTCLELILEMHFHILHGHAKTKSTYPLPSEEDMNFFRENGCSALMAIGAVDWENCYVALYLANKQLLEEDITKVNRQINLMAKKHSPFLEEGSIDDLNKRIMDCVSVAAIKYCLRRKRYFPCFDKRALDNLAK